MICEIPMEDAYKSLEFKKTEVIENPYGIKIYLGSKDKDDWCIEIPKELARKKCRSYNHDYNYVVYLTSEANVLRIAREFTQIAKQFE